jgi:pimeloyl-ACP methyl ester carboxylesterase
MGFTRNKYFKSRYINEFEGKSHFLFLKPSIMKTPFYLVCVVGLFISLTLNAQDLCDENCTGQPPDPNDWAVIERINAHNVPCWYFFNCESPTRLIWLRILGPVDFDLDVSGCSKLCYLDNTVCGYAGGDCSGGVNVDGCYNLRELYLAGFSGNLDVSDCGLLLYLRVDSCLTSLNASGCSSLQSLVCGNNHLTSLDISGCSSLTELECGGNYLSSLNLSDCSSLQYLGCAGNNLTTIDLSSCRNLKWLYCFYNHLTSLNAQGLKNLGEIWCQSNELTHIDISGCSSITYLDFEGNELTYLNASGCSALDYISYMRYGQLTTLILSGCEFLKQIHCEYNQLTTLDLNGCTSLQTLGCDHNQLKTINLDGCVSLNGITCSYNQLNNSSLPCFYGLNLNYLDLRNNLCITNDAIDLLRTNLPNGSNVDVEWDQCYSLTIQNEIHDNASFPYPQELWKGNISQVCPPVKICADGSAATKIIIENVPDNSGYSIPFEIKSDPNNTNPDLYGSLNYPQFIGDSLIVQLNHPAYLPAEYLTHRNDTILIGSNYSFDQPIFKIPIEVYRAPVMMVHGIWANSWSFLRMNFFLWISAFYDPELTMVVDYESTNGKHLQTNANVIPDNINALLIQCRSSKFSAGKVDLVCHSMGGVLARYYMKSEGYQHRQDIHKLITLNTPHSGSHAANLLRSDTPEGQFARLVFEPIVNFMFNSSINDGAVEDLSVNSTELNDLNSESNLEKEKAPSYAIITENTVVNDWTLGWLYDLIAFLVDMTPGEFCDFLFCDRPYDLLVSDWSQSGGLSDTYTSPFDNQSHMGAANNVDIQNEIKYLLYNNPNDADYFDPNGFRPLKLETNYKMLQDTSSLQLVSGSIVIKYPPQGQAFNPGDIIPVEITSTNGIDRIVLLSVNYGSGLSKIDTTMSNGTINFMVPDSSFRHTLFMVLGFDQNNLIDYDTLTININQTATLDSIYLHGDSVYVQVNKTASITVIAYFNNGYNYSVGMFPEVHYQIEDTTFAQYAAFNVIRGKRTGTSMLSVTYLGQTKNIPVVIIPEDTLYYSGIDENNNNQFPKGNLPPAEIENIHIYPNPFNNTTTIEYRLKVERMVSIKVYDIYGKLIDEHCNAKQTAGQHQFIFNGSNLSNGLYILEIRTKNQLTARKLLLAR